MKLVTPQPVWHDATRVAGCAASVGILAVVGYLLGDVGEGFPHISGDKTRLVKHDSLDKMFQKSG